jgi:chemotaxis protein MotA
MDLTTIIGFLAGAMVFGTAMVAGGNIKAYIDIPSVLITGGGMTVAMVIGTPSSTLKGFMKVLKTAFIHKQVDTLALIGRLVRFGEIARRDGILALEGALSEDDDEFLVRGIQMAVDGADPDFINKTMAAEVESMEVRHKNGQKMFESLGMYAPAFGLIGTLIGLIVMLGRLNDPSKVGSGMATALITTFYGAMAANFIWLPIADKLAARNKEELLVKEIIMQGVMSIQSGDNPRVVEQKLKIYLSPPQRHQEFVKRIGR